MEFRLAVLQIAEAAGDAAGLKALSDLEKGLDGWRAGRTGRCCCAAWRRRTTGSAGRRTATGCVVFWPASAADLSGRVLLLEAVLPSEDDALVDGVLADVARLEGEGGAWARYGRAARLVGRAYRGDRAGLAEARTLLNDLARRRPDWSRVALLQGRLAELDGDSSAELDAYRRAFDLGERRADVAQTIGTDAGRARPVGRGRPGDAGVAGANGAGRRPGAAGGGNRPANAQRRTGGGAGAGGGAGCGCLLLSHLVGPAPGRGRAAGGGRIRAAPGGAFPGRRLGRDRGAGVAPGAAGSAGRGRGRRGGTEGVAAAALRRPAAGRVLRGGRPAGPGGRDSTTRRWQSGRTTARRWCAWRRSTCG